MRKLFRNIFLLFTTAIVLIFVACENKHGSVGSQNDNNRKIRITDLATDRNAYKTNEEIKLSYAFINEEASDVTIRNITVQVKDISSTSFPVLYEKKVESKLTLDANAKYTGKAIDLWKIPVDTEKTVCGVCLTYEVDKRTAQSPNQIFLRIVNDGDLITSIKERDSQLELVSIADIDNIGFR